ncbi:hypothetical protein TVAG_151050 [Trichomonas vaginalis G3]|uniref:Uncharacterized protein n=1 Tax=Trichomonas vaginalis (strain ATCC PRA-98 / G3) TaxID=412133 RepID=A2FM17_TRIV3|nr:hypothetical protein TVAGG3_0165800 [Trichomonas vaginalis G3]EAX94058.1 hypothetical protein TVAG_151050 [Trichomonas vaginalis G3]KAI5548212.1 hypothetical protein TVAGG3_0165800 [Trichomonas vaginalis G3]|eukprot:XP_001306988.1 hypothetical protein [Trichomonas vaginalis G3]
MTEGHDTSYYNRIAFIIDTEFTEENFEQYKYSSYIDELSSYLAQNDERSSLLLSLLYEFDKIQNILILIPKLLEDILEKTLRFILLSFKHQQTHENTNSISETAFFVSKLLLNDINQQCKCIIYEILSNSVNFGIEFISEDFIHFVVQNYYASIENNSTRCLCDHIIIFMACFLDKLRDTAPEDLIRLLFEWWLNANTNYISTLQYLLPIIKSHLDIFIEHCHKRYDFFERILSNPLNSLPKEQIRKYYEDLTDFFKLIVSNSTHRFYLKLLKMGFLQIISNILNIFESDNFGIIHKRIYSIIGIMMSQSPTIADFFAENIEIFHKLIPQNISEISSEQKHCVLKLFSKSSPLLSIQSVKNIFGSTDFLQILIWGILEYHQKLGKNCILGLTKLLDNYPNCQVAVLVYDEINESDLFDDYFDSDIDNEEFETAMDNFIDLFEKIPENSQQIAS